MRISDWSSDVCSSDLRSAHSDRRTRGERWPRNHAGDHSHRLLKGEARHGWRSEDDELRRPRPWPLPHRRDRSEEHTSELQSLMRISYAVFCLKKKKITIHNTIKSYKPSTHKSR